MAGFKSDGDFTIEKATAKPEFSQPIPGVPIDYILRQRFMQFAANYSAPAENSAHPDYSTFKFAEDSDRKIIGGGIATWTRTWAKKPATFDVWETGSLNLIGLLGYTGINVGFVQGRDRRVISVTTRVQHDFFLVGTGGDYATPGDIPAVRQLLFCGFNGTVGQGSVDIPLDILQYNTVPTVNEFKTMMAIARQRRWSASVVTQSIIASTGVIRMDPKPPTGGQYVAEDSILQRWTGNVFVRATRYVLAQ